MDADKGVPGRMAFVWRCTRHLNPLGSRPCLFNSRAYQMSITLPARVPVLPLCTWIVSALAVWMYTVVEVDEHDVAHCCGNVSTGDCRGRKRIQADPCDGGAGNT